VRGVAAFGISWSPAEIGSEASPICWLVRLLAAIETIAAAAMPSSANPDHRTHAGTLIGLLEVGDGHESRPQR
jgi:hypothetical protein